MNTGPAQWVVSNRVSRNIVYVALEGDISDDGNRVVTQWHNATNALYRLEDPARTGLPDGIPYGMAVGNHDTYNGGTARFNQFFGTNHFAGHRYYGGNYCTNIVLSLTMAAGADPALLGCRAGRLSSLPQWRRRLSAAVGVFSQQ